MDSSASSGGGAGDGDGGGHGKREARQPPSQPTAAAGGPTDGKAVELAGAGMFAVYPRTDCPHLSAAVKKTTTAERGTAGATAACSVRPDAGTACHIRERGGTTNNTAHVAPSLASRRTVERAFRSRCSACDESVENWMCLACGHVACSRYVRGHARRHGETARHAVALSFADLSAHCYECDAYVTGEAVRPFTDALHEVKFGAKPPCAAGGGSGGGGDSGKRDETRAERDADECTDGPADSADTANTTSASEATCTLETTAAAAGAAANAAVTDSPSPSSRQQQQQQQQERDAQDDEANVLERILRKLSLPASPSRAAPALDGIDPPTLDGVARALVHNAARLRNRVLVLCGAGISCAAGIPDFRSRGTGLYANLARYRVDEPTDLFDIDFFRDNPRPFYDLARELNPRELRPTTAHHFIRLLHDKQLLLRCYTQNIDGLERMAGVPDDALVEAHGSFRTSRCIAERCRKQFESARVIEAMHAGRVPTCDKCGAYVKPDIVFFGEALPRRFHRLVGGDVQRARLCIIVGTSLTVAPVMLVPDMLPRRTPRVLLNLTASGDIGSRGNDVVALGDAQVLTERLAAACGWREALDALRTSDGRR